MIEAKEGNHELPNHLDIDELICMGILVEFVQNKIKGWLIGKQCETTPKRYVNTPNNIIY